MPADLALCTLAPHGLRILAVSSNFQLDLVATPNRYSGREIAKEDLLSLVVRGLHLRAGFLVLHQKNLFEVAQFNGFLRLILCGSVFALVII